MGVNMTDEEYTNLIEKETKIYKENPESLYDVKFFRYFSGCSRGWQNEAGRIIAEDLKISSAIDFGCGSGFYLEGMYLTGCKNIIGIEYMYENAAPYIPELIKDNISKGNAMEPINKGIFDISVSIEVAEHLLPEKSDIFIDNITNSSSKYIFFSAAPIGQGGRGHINEQPIEFWLEKLNNKGFIYSDEITQRIKNKFVGMPRQKKTTYFRYMMPKFMFFIRK